MYMTMKSFRQKRPLIALAANFGCNSSSNKGSIRIPPEKKAATNAFLLHSCRRTESLGKKATLPPVRHPFPRDLICITSSALDYPRPPHAPLIRLASWTSFCIIVTRLAWMAHRLVSSKRCTMNASAASWSACMAWLCQRRESPSTGSRERPISRTCVLCQWRLLNWALAIETYEAGEGQFEE